MPFLNPFLLLGALGGAIPVIIHLLNRRRFKITRWAAMEFLLASLKKNYKRVRMENLLLLLLRILMVLLIALALARPRLVESGILGALGTESRHAIIILDNSCSMRLSNGSTTCFDRAKGMAQQILASLNKGDVVSLLSMSDVARPVIKEATLDIGLVRREIKRAEPGWGGTDIGRSLIAAADLLASSKKPRKEVFIITDMQARGWGKKDQEPGDELKAALARIRKEAKAFVVDAGADGATDNLAVTKLEPLSRIIGTGSPAEMKADVTNFGNAKTSGVQVKCLVDRFSQDMKELHIAPGDTEPVTFTRTFRTEGAHLIQAQVVGDRLRADNIRHLAVHVEKFIRVLLVNGETSPELEENETYYIERALRPPVDDGGRRVSYVEPTTITEFAVSSTDFSRYRLVVLANLASLAGKNAVTRIEEYVRDGGSLLVFLGDRVDAAFYNEQLFKGGRGLLPARLGDELGGSGNTRSSVHIEIVKPVHPIFGRFTGERAFYINRSLLFYKYVDLKLPAGKKDVRVVAKFETGSPAIVEKAFGRGRVVLVASSCDAEWTNFPKAAAYAVVMQDLVDHLGAGDFSRRNVLVHAPYRRTFAAEELVDTVTIRPPGGAGAEKTLRPYRVGAPAASGDDAAAAPAVTEIVFTETDAAGLYELEVKRKDGVKAPVEYFSVNIPPEESDLRRIEPGDAAKAIKGFEFKYAKSVSGLALAVRESRTGREFARALLLAVLIISCIELILAQLFGR